MKKFRLRARLNFFIERQFVRGAWSQLLLVAALIGLISVVGGALVVPSGEPTGTLDEAVWWAFLRLTDPGYLGDDQGVWRRIVSTIITIAGYVIFLGSLVAIISTWLNRKIRNLEQGLTPVAANNHLVILGWTNRTIPIAAEIFQSSGRVRRFLKQYRARSLQLVILSEDVTPDHRQELRDYPLIGDRALDIVLRSGDAIDREHLRRVDSLNAAAIIIPSRAAGMQQLITPDIETIKALLSLNAESALQNRKRMPYVVAEIQDENKRSAAHRAYNGPLEVICSNSLISRLLTQNMRHPGLSEVYNELLTRSIGNNIFVRENSAAAGLSFDRVKVGYLRSILIGIVRADGSEFTPYINPPSDLELESGDRLVLIARSPEDLVWKAPATDPAPVATTRAQLPPVASQAPTRVLILGWNNHVPSLIQELGTYANESFQLTIAALRPLAERQRDLELLPESAEHVPAVHLEIDYVKESQLRKIKPADFDRILLVSSDRLAQEEEADARTLVGYVLLEELLEGATHRPQVILELADPSNESLIRRFRSEVIISPMILSHLLAAVALRRELNSIYNELLTAGGAEITFRRPTDYGLTAERITFAELEQRAAEYQETALGTYTGDLHNGERVTLALNPDRRQNLTLTGNVKLVVLTSSLG